jgi:hypothetical protein
MADDRVSPHPTKAPCGCEIHADCILHRLAPEMLVMLGKISEAVDRIKRLGGAE